jgi:hypothetical protein
VLAVAVSGSLRHSKCGLFVGCANDRDSCYSQCMCDCSKMSTVLRVVSHQIVEYAVGGLRSVVTRSRTDL